MGRHHLVLDRLGEQVNQHHSDKDKSDTRDGVGVKLLFVQEVTGNSYEHYAQPCPDGIRDPHRNNPEAQSKEEKANDVHNKHTNGWP